MAAVISFINLKGGVGKTTCCANIAGELANSHRKVLVIDMDAQANISTLLMGPEKYMKEILLEDEVIENKEDKIISKTGYQIFYDAINNNKKNSYGDIIKKGVFDKLKTLDLLPVSFHLWKLDQKIVHYDRNRLGILKKAVEKFKDQYDIIFIDCPPNIYTATKNALYASDYYIIPTLPDYLSLTGIDLLIDQLNMTIEAKKEENLGSVKLAGILVNRFSYYRRDEDCGIQVHEAGLRKIHEKLNYFIENSLVDESAKVFSTKISQTTEIEKASGKFLPLCLYAPKHKINAEYKCLCAEILSQINGSGTQI